METAQHLTESHSAIEKQFIGQDGRPVITLRGRSAAIDIGNTEVNCIFGSEKSRFVFPNVIAEMSFDDVLEQENDILEGLRVKIDSPALNRKWGTLAVGQLAARQQDERREISPGSIKANEDQSFIVFLTALAVDAVKHFAVKDGVCFATYCLSGGLPISEFKNKELRKQFKQKITNGVHKVTFLETASPYRHVEVHLEVFDVKLSSEGQAANLELTTDAFGGYKPLPGTEGNYMILDNGGGTLDCAVILAGGKTDNERSKGEQKLGINKTLDSILDSIYSKYNVTFESRKQLADHILASRKGSPLSTQVKDILVQGKPKPIQDIVDGHLRRYAQTIYEYMKRKWNEVSNCQSAYFIGGASNLIRPYLSELNQGEGMAGEYVIYFLDPNQSFWILAEAYHKIGVYHREHGKKRKIVLIPPQAP
ncbi:hypothetical protein ADL26_11300 [Thermoactinomyces vulgaris]|uniref:ParM/StbA family protein n=1 Tax=Laceyella sacchari TaxID=37482 RepID=UPI0006B8901F|nr:ParM/StbA family protein [Laceyella sacchari]KPC74362.1 hypothetical protein ADL26_11300 [Thermoactinomyces vulgaris]TCW41287.1 plasmid segregation protein ParM [Laceyella sacchari]